MLCVLLHLGGCLNQRFVLVVHCAVLPTKRSGLHLLIAPCFFFFCLNKPLANWNYTQLLRNVKSSGKRSICSSILQSHLLQHEAVGTLILSLTVVAHLCWTNSSQFPFFSVCLVLVFWPHYQQNSSFPMRQLLHFMRPKLMNISTYSFKILVPSPWCNLESEFPWFILFSLDINPV